MIDLVKTVLRVFAGVAGLALLVAFASDLETVCVDGWRSVSSGPGTCSWHGGVSTPFGPTLAFFIAMGLLTYAVGLGGKKADTGPSLSDEGPHACPKCGSAMVRRTRRRDNQDFLGCVRFPECRGSRDYRTST